MHKQNVVYTNNKAEIQSHPEVARDKEDLLQDTLL